MMFIYFEMNQMMRGEMKTRGDENDKHDEPSSLLKTIEKWSQMKINVSGHRHLFLSNNQHNSSTYIPECGTYILIIEMKMRWGWIVIFSSFCFLRKRKWSSFSSSSSHHHHQHHDDIKYSKLSWFMPVIMMRFIAGRADLIMCRNTN